MSDAGLRVFSQFAVSVAGGVGAALTAGDGMGSDAVTLALALFALDKGVAGVRNVLRSIGNEVRGEDNSYVDSLLGDRAFRQSATCAGFTYVAANAGDGYVATAAAVLAVDLGIAALRNVGANISGYNYTAHSAVLGIPGRMLE